MSLTSVALRLTYGREEEKKYMPVISRSRKISNLLILCTSVHNFKFIEFFKNTLVPLSLETVDS